MPLPLLHDETSLRRSTMLHTAFCDVVRRALASQTTLEVMANPDGSVWTDEAGKGVTDTGARLSAADRERVIRLVASACSTNTDPASAIVSAELPGTGERFEGLLPPISTAPCFSIRKPASSPYSLSDYVDQGAVSPALAAALAQAIEARDNIVIAGGTSSGKTSFINALLGEPAFADDRIVILEDTRELRCSAANTVSLRTQSGAVSLCQLVRSTLRLRPDRIIVGEVRGAEALDLLKAWNTGHPGGLTTLHANSATGALQRLEQLVLEATPFAPHNLIAEAVNVVVFMSRASGARRIEEAIRVMGHDGEDYITEPLAGPQLSLVRQGEAP